MPDLRHAADLLRRGRLVAFPTETVYGLGADATNPAAIDRIYRTKGRPSTNPLIVHVADVATARRYVTNWPAVADRLAARFWPGPLTLILPKRLPTQGAIPDNATAGLNTVALRVPDHPLALALLREFAGPLAAPSANRSTRVSPTTAQHVRDEFPHAAAAGGPPDNDPALILDGGPCDVGIESTVLDLTTTPPAILRPGRVTAADLAPVIGAVRTAPATAVDPARPAASPGQHETHYAPATPAYRFDTSQRGLIRPENHGVIVLSPLRVFKDRGTIFAMPNDPAGYARHLYGVLRKLDAKGLAAIFVEMPPDVPEWAPIRDRLTRATRPFAAFG